MAIEDSVLAAASSATASANSALAAAASANTAQYIAENLGAFPVIDSSVEYPTRALFVAANTSTPGVGLIQGQTALAAGLQYRREVGATAISDLPGWVPNDQSTPFHFGAVGNNVADDRAAFAAMNAYGGPVYIPKPPVAWNVSSPIAMNNVSVTMDPTMTWAQGTDDGAISWGPAPTAFYPDTDGAAITRIHDRLFVHQGADFTGNFNGSQQGFVPLGSDGGAWGARDAALLVAQDRGLLSVVGWSSNENPERDNAIANCAVAGFAIGNKSTGVGGSSARTFYGDLQFEEGQYGFGIELALKNKTGVTIDCTPYTRDFKVTGFWIVPGGDVSYGGSPTADVCVAMAFGGSTGTGMKFNKGIVFWANSLRPDVNGRGQALLLGQSQEVAWYSTGTGTFKITSEGQTTTNTEIMSDNEGVQIRGFSTETATLGVGTGRTGDGRSQLFLRSDGAAQQSMAVIAYSGANGIREIRTRGTGALQMVTQDAAPIVLATNNNSRMVVSATGEIGIGNSGVTGAALAISSTTGGLLNPRMTTSERDAIPSPQNGLQLYNTSTNKLQVRAAGAWVDLH
jgi:hypothetical protein